jgi:multiple sugar transport system substrate-binding protein
MQGKQSKTLRGITWKHDRGLAPLLATARHFCEEHPGISIEWKTRSLQEFGEASLQGLADTYDLVVIDHPFMGHAARERCFLALDEHIPPDQLRERELDSVGPSYKSYCFQGHLWALPIDAAAQVAGYRADLLEKDGFNVPRTWKEVFELASFRQGFVSPALSPLDSLMCFFTLCANLGEPPFTRNDTVVSANVGHEALEYVRMLGQHASRDALSANPIAVWERMSSSDEIAYCPLAFGYSNYARDAYRANPVSFCSIPSGGRGPIGATLGGAGLAISEKCTHRDVAVEYASWVSGRGCQRTLYVESGGQPASKAAWLDFHANEITNGYFASTLPVLENAWLRPCFAGFERFQVAATRIIAQFLSSTKTAHEALEELDTLYRHALSN